MDRPPGSLLKPVGERGGVRTGGRVGKSKNRPKRKKPATYAKLKRDLDAIFSRYVRQSQNIPHCISCGVVKPAAELQCGHFVSRVRLATRWEPRNCAPQCLACNVWRRGNPIGYAQYLLREYGPNIFAELDEQSRRPMKVTRSDLTGMIEYYRQKLEAL